MHDGLVPVDVGPQLPARAQRVDEDAAAVREVDELAQVDVPVALPRPRDLLAGLDDVARPDEHVDVLVAEVRDVDEPARAGSRRPEDATALDRVHAMRAPGRRAAPGDVVADGDVDAVVVDAALLVVGAWVEERPADRVLTVEGADGPPPPLVVIGPRAGAVPVPAA